MKENGINLETSANEMKNPEISMGKIVNPGILSTYNLPFVITLLEQKVAWTKSREVAQCFEKKMELIVAGSKSCGTKSRVELIVAQNFKTKFAGT